jgi:hypothetical protein
MAYSRVLWPWALLPAMAMVGCELLVPDTLPQYSCGPGSDSCPPGMICDPATQQCVAPGGDSAPPPDGSPDNFVADTGIDNVTMMDVVQETSSCKSLNCPCSGPSDCTSSVCADQVSVTPQLWSAVGHGFCTQACCTSSDCPTGFVCFGTAAGGNYCVNPSLLSRGVPAGTSAGGASCSTDAQCRSGLCSGSICQDTCCSTTAANPCATGYSCRYQAFPGRASFDNHFTSSCATSGGSGGDGANCSTNSTCKSDLCCGGGGCSFDTCLSACRNSADSGSNHYCGYASDSSNNVVATCQSPDSASVGLGGSCSSPSDCATYTCDMTSKKCTDVCYTSSDCAAMPGWICRPEIITVMGGGGSFSVLLCGT